MRVTEIWRYPVKSMGGERLETVSVNENGLEGDRSYGIVDDETGYVLTARREPRLLQATASLIDGELVITTATGEILAGTDDVKRWLGRSVTLTAAGSTGGTYENPLDFENDDDWQSWTGPGDAWHDSAKSRVSIVSQATLGEWDVRRFRTNLVTDGSGEDDLVGARLVVGTTQLEVTKPISRCVMVTRPQPGLERDLGVLKTINNERAGTLSIGAAVTATGTISIGDEISAAR